MPPSFLNASESPAQCGPPFRKEEHLAATVPESSLAMIFGGRKTYRGIFIVRALVASGGWLGSGEG